MAGNRPSTGLNVMTVQEATNKISQRNVIRVTPTVIAGTTANGDVMFNATEIPNAVLTPGGTSSLKCITIIDKAGEAHDMDIIFMQVQTNFGTADSASTITDANLQAAKVLGAVKLDWTDVDTLVAQDSGSASIVTFSQWNGDNKGLNPMFLKAEEGSTSVYFTAISREEMAYAATDDLEFVFHIDY